MKKLCSLIILLMIVIIPLSVKAEEKLNFDWGQYIDLDYDMSNYATDVEKLDNGYLVYGQEYAFYYDNEGKITNKYYSDGYCDYIKYNKTTNQFLCIYEDYDYSNNKYTTYIYILDDKMNIVKQNQFDKELKNYFYQTYFNETEDDYIIVDIYSGYTYIITKDLSSFNIYKLGELSEDKLKNYWQDYYIIYKIYKENPDINREYYRVSKNDKYILVSYYNYDTENSGIELYDKKYNKIFDQKINNKNLLITELTNDGYYVLTENDISSRDDCKYQKECSSQLELTKYNFNQEKIYSEDLQKLISKGADYYYGEGRLITSFKLSNNGLILLSNYLSEPKDYVPDISEELTGREPAILKYYFTYNIDTKVDGKGNIKVINTSKSGDSVTFEVTPEEGYVLGVVKVTDKNGNVLTFTSNTFTMPNSDVTIEVTFLPENPNTTDTISYLILLFTLIIIFTIYIRTEQKRNYYRKINK